MKNTSASTSSSTKKINGAQPPQDKTPVAEAIEGSEPSRFEQLYADAEALMAAFGANDGPSLKRRVVSGLIAFVAMCGATWLVFPMLLAGVVMVEAAIGVGFISFVCGALALLITWYATAKVGEITYEALSSCAIERAALGLWHRATGVFTRKPAAATVH